MYFRHDLGYTYPEQSDAHMLKAEKKKELIFDENYSFLPKGFFYKALRVIYFILLNLIVFPLCRLTHGLKIEGKENLKKHPPPGGCFLIMKYTTACWSYTYWEA